MNTFFRILLLVTMAVFAINSCEEEVDDTQRKLQEQRFFNLYMDANYPDLQPMESGLYYTSVTEGTGALPDSGDFVLINYVTFTIPDEVVSDTYDEDWARENNLYVNGVMYGPYKYEVGTEIDGLDEGVMQMREGGISRLIFKSDLGYGSTGYSNTIQAYESLMIDVQLLEVIESPAAFENALIMDYLDTISIDDYKAIYDDETESTYYYIEDEAGSGENLAEGDELTVYYEGSLLDGRVFDTNFESKGGFDVELGTSNVIRGWTIGLTNFKRGGKGRLILPNALAYGESGEVAAGSGKYSIPPLEPLLFEIEVEEESDEEE